MGLVPRPPLAPLSEDGYGEAPPLVSLVGVAGRPPRRVASCRWPPRLPPPLAGLVAVVAELMPSAARFTAVRPRRDVDARRPVAHDARR